MPKNEQPKYCISRRRLNSIIVAAFILLAVLVFVDKSTPPLTPPGRDTTVSKNRDWRVFHQENFKVTYVVDGDTLDIDHPDVEFDDTRVRLLGVDTPETKHTKRGMMYFGKQAFEFTEKAALGQTITIYLDSASPTRDRYGRLLAYVQLENGEFLNEELVKEGMGYADLRFRHSLYNKYVHLMKIARTNRKGLWKEVTRWQLPGWLQRERPKLLLD